MVWMILRHGFLGFQLDDSADLVRVTCLLSACQASRRRVDIQQHHALSVITQAFLKSSNTNNNNTSFLVSRTISGKAAACLSMGMPVLQVLQGVVHFLYIWKLIKEGWKVAGCVSDSRDDVRGGVLGTVRGEPGSSALVARLGKDGTRGHAATKLSYLRIQ